MNQFDGAVNQFIEKGNSLDREGSPRTGAVKSVLHAMNEFIWAGNWEVVRVRSRG